MSSRERQLWTEFVRKREGRKDEKPARKRRVKKPQLTPAELEARSMIWLTRRKAAADKAGWPPWVMSRVTTASERRNGSASGSLRGSEPAALSLFSKPLSNARRRRARKRLS